MDVELFAKSFDFLTVQNFDIGFEKRKGLDDTVIVEVSNNVKEKFYFLYLKIDDYFFDIKIEKDCIEGDLRSFFVEENYI